MTCLVFVNKARAKQRHLFAFNVNTLTHLLKVALDDFLKLLV